MNDDHSGYMIVQYALLCSCGWKAVPHADPLIVLEQWKSHLDTVVSSPYVQQRLFDPPEGE